MISEIFGRRIYYFSSLSSEARSRIGRNSQRLLYDTRNFFERTHTPDYGSEIFDTSVELRIQNDPDDVLLTINGLKSYRRTVQILRWFLRNWYTWRYNHLQVQVTRLPGLSEDDNTGHTMRLKWRLEGQPRQLFSWTSSEAQLSPCNIIAGYSIYQFDIRTGRVRHHLVDRLVPPTARGSLLWRYLERFQFGALHSPKPLVDSNNSNPHQLNKTTFD